MIIFQLLTYLSLWNANINDIFVSKMDKNTKNQRFNKELLDKIALRIKQLRNEKNISQLSFYNDTEIHIARIELGKINITVSTLKEICDYFGITLSEFFKDIK